MSELDDAGPVVLVAFRAYPPAELIDGLGADNLLEDRWQWIFRCNRPPREVARLLLGIRDPPLSASAAVLADMPARDALGVATEWVGQLVIEASLLDALGADAAGWEVAYETGYEKSTLLVMKPREDRGPEHVEDESSGIARVETPDDFRGAIESARAVTTIASTADVQADASRWFGELAESSVGGAIALLMTAPPVDDHSDRVLLHSPAALGLEVGEPAAGLEPLAVRFGLTIRAWGVSYAGPHSARELLLTREPGLDPADLERALAEHVQPIGCDYAIAGILHAAIDPTVRLGAGAIFEQDALRDEQNLVVASPTRVEVPLGRFIPIILPAWCMNVQRRGPAGGAMRPTALTMPRPPATQDAVWRRIRDAVEPTR